MATSTAVLLGKASQTLAIGVHVSDSLLPPGSSQFIGFLKAANAVGSTVSAVIEQSPDGVNWTPVYTLSTAGNAVDTDVSLQIMFAKIRATVTVAGAPADVTCQMWFDPGKG